MGRQVSARPGTTSRPVKCGWCVDTASPRRAAQGTCATAGVGFSRWNGSTTCMGGRARRGGGGGVPNIPAGAGTGVRWSGTGRGSSRHPPPRRGGPGAFATGRVGFFRWDGSTRCMGGMGRCGGSACGPKKSARPVRFWSRVAQGGVEQRAGRFRLHELLQVNYRLNFISFQILSLEPDCPLLVRIVPPVKCGGGE